MRTEIPPRCRRLDLVMMMVLALCPLGLGGCHVLSSSKGHLEFTSIEAQSPVRLKTDYQTAVFRRVGKNQVTVVLSDLPADDLAAGKFGNGVVTCIEMFWRPKAGRTPLDPTSTNTTVRQVIFAGEGMGIYRGAGFMSPTSKQGAETFASSVSVDSIELDDATKGFHDAIGRARLDGSFTAKEDAALVDAVAVRLNTEATRRLGELHFVLGR